MAKDSKLISIDWTGNNSKLTWDLIGELEKPENRKVIFGKVDQEVRFCLCLLQFSGLTQLRTPLGSLGLLSIEESLRPSFRNSSPVVLLSMQDEFKGKRTSTLLS